MSTRLDRGGGVSIAWDSHGSGTPPILLLPAWSIVHSRVWKLQVPYLARHHRVITFDPRGNGASSRPGRPVDFADACFVADAVAVLDAAGIDAALLVGLSMGADWGVQLAAEHPERVLGLVTLGAALPLSPPLASRVPYDAEAWRADFTSFLEAFFAQCFSEPHSTRQIEEGIAWGQEIGPETLALTLTAPGLGRRRAEAACRAVRCPVLAIHGDDDRTVPHEGSVRLAELTGGELITVENGGHIVNARDPVLVNGLIHDFAERLVGRTPRSARWRRALTRPRRALYVSSPIGLGHARRDMAIARELRARVPGLEIDWLAQEPTAAVLRAAGERVHPMSRHLLSESDHVDAWGGDHELWVFEVIRTMDAILLANYLVFRDVVHAEPYDLWIGDEAWDLDYYLHENPEDKRAPFAWLTDFVGWLALPEHGEREAALVADLNAEMIEHVERFPSIRDVALFVGDPDDIVPGTFGPGLPEIRDWTERHFRFTGQIVDRAPAPERNGGPPQCVVSVGGSGTGGELLRRAVAALEPLRERVPDARMLAVTGPRLDPAALAAAEGLDVAGYVADLNDRLAGADVALVHGGLTTGMELVAAGTPFVSVPLRGHFEQLGHVRHRLERHGHRRVVEAADATPERLARELASALAAPPAYRAVSDGGAARAAELIADLL